MTFPFEAPQAMRSLGITPVLAMLVALGLVIVAYCVLVLARSRWAAPAVGALAAAAVALIVWINLTTFFGPQMNDPTVWESFSTRDTIPITSDPRSWPPARSHPRQSDHRPDVAAATDGADVQRTIRAFDASSDLPYRGQRPGDGRPKPSTRQALRMRWRATTRMPPVWRSCRPTATSRPSTRWG